jgi:hypothetical protein
MARKPSVRLAVLPSSSPLMQYRNDPTALRRAAQLPVGLEANDADALGKRSIAGLAELAFQMQ